MLLLYRKFITLNAGGIQQIVYKPIELVGLPFNYRNWFSRSVMVGDALEHLHAGEDRHQWISHFMRDCREKTDLRLISCSGRNNQATGVFCSFYGVVLLCINSSAAPQVFARLARLRILHIKLWPMAMPSDP